MDALLLAWRSLGALAVVVEFRVEENVKGGMTLDFVLALCTFYQAGKNDPIRGDWGRAGVGCLGVTWCSRAQLWIQLAG